MHHQQSTIYLINTTPDRMEDGLLQLDIQQLVVLLVIMLNLDPEMYTGHMSLMNQVLLR